jgi:hypothetical protein
MVRSRCAARSGNLDYHGSENRPARNNFRTTNFRSCRNAPSFAGIGDVETLGSIRPASEAVACAHRDLKSKCSGGRRFGR